MPTPSPNSVSLKLNSTSVMLYTNQYVRLPDGRGASIQTYLASFSRKATDIPPLFETALREATRGQPARYQALIARIDNEVLRPARIRHQQEEAVRQRNALVAALGHVVQGLTDIPEMPGYLTLTGSAEFQRLLLELQAGTQRVLEARVVNECPSREPVESPEKRLQRLLLTVSSACADIAELMPTARQAFPRGYRFAAETIEQVRQLWFSSSHAIASLSARSQLRRPRNWSAGQD